MPFKNAARPLFDQFNSSQLLYIVGTALAREIDTESLGESGVIESHFPVHMPKRRFIRTSWEQYKMRLSWGMLSQRFLNNM